MSAVQLHAEGAGLADETARFVRRRPVTLREIRSEQAVSTWPPVIRDADALVQATLVLNAATH
jgi:hypothetical protein